MNNSFGTCENEIMNKFHGMKDEYNLSILFIPYYLDHKDCINIHRRKQDWCNFVSERRMRE